MRGSKKLAASFVFYKVHMIHIMEIHSTLFFIPDKWVFQNFVTKHHMSDKRC